MLLLSSLLYFDNKQCLVIMLSRRTAEIFDVSLYKVGNIFARRGMVALDDRDKGFFTILLAFVIKRFNQTVRICDKYITRFNFLREIFIFSRFLDADRLACLRYFC